MTILSAFTDHPASVGESYFEHMGVASRFSANLLLAGLACMVHAVLPFAFVKTGSKMINGLYSDMVSHRQRKPLPNNQAPTPNGIVDFVI